MHSNDGINPGRWVSQTDSFNLPFRNSEIRFMSIKYGVLAIAVSSMMATSSFAHHVGSDDLDLDTIMILEGRIVNVEWTNPHVVLHVEVLNEYGAKKLWLVHADTPNALLQNGLDRSSLSAENDVELEVYPFVRHNCATACLSYGVTVTLEHGRIVPLNEPSDIEL